MPTYRPLAGSEHDEFRALTEYAFRPHEISPRDDRSTLEPPAWADLSTNRGLFDDGELVSTVAHYWHTLRVRGEMVTVGGIANVSTPPKHRRNGYVRTVLADSLEEYREREIAFSALWPFDIPFYRRLGWERCSDVYRITCTPDALAFVDDVSQQGSFVELSPDRIDDLDSVYTACHDHDLAMDRSTEWWHKRVFDYRTEPFVTGVERNGTLVGYLVYSIDDTDERTLTVHEQGYRDTDAYCELLRFCRYHDSQVTAIEFDVVRPLLWDVVPDPSLVTVERRPGAMFRVVDVERALDSIAYDDTGDITISVSDPIAEWNETTVALAVESDDVSCVPTTDSPSIELGIQQLSAIVSGYWSPSKLSAIGQLTGETAAIERFDRMLPASDPAVVEFF